MKTFYIAREPLAKLAILLGFAIALFAPPDILDWMPWFRTISGAMMAVFPPIKYYAQKSQFPQVSELFFTVMWLVSPVHFYGFRRDLSEKINPRTMTFIAQKQITGLGEAIRYFVIVVLIMPGALIGCWFINQGYDYLWLPMNSSRIALGIGGWFFAGAGGWWAICLEYVFLVKISRDIKDRFSKKK